MKRRKVHGRAARMEDEKVAEVRTVAMFRRKTAKPVGISHG